jgi:hypothetical protein
MEFIFHNSFDRSCRLNSVLSQRYRIPNSRERVKTRSRPKKHEQTDKEAVHIEDTFKMVLPFDCMDIHMFNKVKRQ